MRRALPPLLLLLVCFVYAAARYVVFKGDALAQLPLYVFGKAVALASLVLLGVASTSYNPQRRRWAGEWAVTLASLHGVMALSVLRPAYLPKLFSGGEAGTRLSGPGELALLAGAVGLVALLRVSWGGRTQPLEASAPGLRGRLAGALVLAVTGVHGTAMGWAGWWRPELWPGGMPPITLLSTLYAFGAALLALARSRSGGRGGSMHDGPRAEK